ncbi:hypothetical protein GCM10020216_013120 [Nonomuraea helvata]
MRTLAGVREWLAWFYGRAMFPISNGWPELDPLAKRQPGKKKPRPINPNMPNVARTYGCFLSWKENYEAGPFLDLTDAEDPYAESDAARVDFVGGAGRKA